MSLNYRIEKYLIINENWVEAEKRWVNAGQIDKENFDELKNKFTVFGKKNLLPAGKERDIAFWMKKPVSEFKDFMKGVEDFAKKKEAQKGKMSDALVVFENARVKVLIPKTLEASCEYGQNTTWCTAGKVDNTFQEYIYGKGTSLYYLIVKGAPMDERLMYDKESFVRKLKITKENDTEEKALDAYMNISPKNYNKIAIAMLRKDKLKKLDSGKMQAQMQIFDTLDNMMRKDWLKRFCELYKVPYDVFTERTEEAEGGYRLKG